MDLWWFATRWTGRAFTLPSELASPRILILMTVPTYYADDYLSSKHVKAPGDEFMIYDPKTFLCCQPRSN